MKRIQKNDALRRMTIRRRVAYFNEIQQTKADRKLKYTRKGNQQNKEQVRSKYKLLNELRQ